MAGNKVAAGQDLLFPIRHDLSMAEVVADAERLPLVTHVENWRA